MAKKDAKVELNENNLENISGGKMTRLRTNSPLYKEGLRAKVVTQNSDGTELEVYCKSVDAAKNLDKKLNSSPVSSTSSIPTSDLDRMVGI